MTFDLRTVSGNMREFGCHTIGRAIYDSVFNEMGRPYVHAMSVNLAAHAAEILIKARIAEEHPLLIFDTLPKSKSTSGSLDILGLFEHGRTIMFNELPDRLWATTGYRIKEIEQFMEFGRLRNKIVHFAIPEVKLSDICLHFAFEVIDNFLQDFWDDTVLPYAEEFDDIIVSDGYMKERLDGLNIRLTNNSSVYLQRTDTIS